MRSNLNLNCRVTSTFFRPSFRPSSLPPLSLFVVSVLQSPVGACVIHDDYICCRHTAAIAAAAAAANTGTYGAALPTLHHKRRAVQGSYDVAAPRWACLFYLCAWKLESSYVLVCMCGCCLVHFRLPSMALAWRLSWSLCCCLRCFR